MAKLMCGIEAGDSVKIVKTLDGRIAVLGRCLALQDDPIAMVVASPGAVSVWLRACLREIEGDGGCVESSEQTIWCACGDGITEDSGALCGVCARDAQGANDEG